MWNAKQTKNVTIRKSALEKFAKLPRSAWKVRVSASVFPKFLKQFGMFSFTDCPELKCDGLCRWGNVEVDGCATCQCLPDPCEVSWTQRHQKSVMTESVSQELDCPNGYICRRQDNCNGPTSCKWEARCDVGCKCSCKHNEPIYMHFLFVVSPPEICCPNGNVMENGKPTNECNTKCQVCFLEFLKLFLL
jgi:hypothetical protein